jgi:zinc protease
VRAGAPPHRPSSHDAKLSADIVLQLEDDVHLPRLYMTWHSPSIFQPGDAELDIAAHVLGSGKTARLYQRLVHELEIAQDVEAEQESGLLGSTLALSITAREGITLRQIEAEARNVLQQTVAELNERELQRARHHIETATIDSIQGVGGFGGKADRLNHYFFYTGDAGYLPEDLRRYEVLTPDHVRAQLASVISAPSVTLSVVPQNKRGLAVGA